MNIDSFANVSDEEFEKYLETGGNGSESVTQEPLDEASSASDPQLDDTPENDGQSSTEAPQDELEASEEAENGEENNSEENTEEQESSTDEPENKPSEEEAQTGELDELFKPFKASGKDFQVKSMDEARRLMSMGVDYSQKLEGFKQHRKTIKTLEANKVTDEDLNFFIDLKNGNKDAIAKLIQDHKIDTMDLDSEQEGSDYTPTNHSVSDSQVELDDVISRIQDSESFSRTSDIVSNQWDDASKKIIFEQPALLATLNEQVSNGTFDRIMTEVQRAKVFGGLQGLTDIQAYDMVGKQLAQADAQSATTPNKQVSTKPDPKPNNTQQKMRVSTQRKAPTQKAQPQTKGFARMTDAEFEKLLNGSN